MRVEDAEAARAAEQLELEQAIRAAGNDEAALAEAHREALARQQAKADELAKLDYFRELQLRARDGELTGSDYDYIFHNMDYASRMAEFSGPETYHLVTTRKMRDEHNARELESHIRRGLPAMRIGAIDQPANGKLASMEDEDVGLPCQLHLCVGARVMVTHNLSVTLGLVNGTSETVHDILTDSAGQPVSVLVRVKRGTATRDGYRGPSFLGEQQMRDAGLDPDRECVVSIARWKSEIWDGGQLHQRQQFPLM